jgi:diphthamide biosynthesis protein 2
MFFGPFILQLQVLFGLEYAHSIQQIRKVLLESSTSCKSDLKSEFHFADVPSPYMFPSKDIKKLSGIQEEACGCGNNSSSDGPSGTIYNIGGLTWKLPEGQSMEDYSLIWIGQDNSAFANVVLTFNACDIG